VLPAKLALRRRTGAAIAGLFLRELEPGLWEVMLRTRGKVQAGESLLAGDHTFLLESRAGHTGEGVWRVRITPTGPAAEILAAIGRVPLPPYIERQRKETGHAPERADDCTWYQTVYAHAGPGGSVAAPTAGLHFTPALLEQLAAQGVRRAAVELHVGLGTFQPVETDTLEEHRMHTEPFHIPAATIAAIRQTRAAGVGGRLVLVGTTAVRTLESTADRILSADPPADISGETDLKIAPGFPFRLTDALITNFHLPRSTLMALVAAFLSDDEGGGGGPRRLKECYALALKLGYRFYSYGDAMLIT
jgi:S-adenosylmethionine:tRNA ribosyltransferase-isomerase